MIQIDQANPVTTEAITVWGPEGQLAIIQEEAAEVIAAVAQYNRDRVGKDKIAEEIADFFVSAMSVIAGLDIEQEVQMEMRYKIQRLSIRIDKIKEK